MSVRELKASFSENLSALEKMARARLIVNNSIQPHLHRIALLRKALDVAADHDAIWELLNPINRLKEEMTRPPAAHLAVHRFGVSSVHPAAALPFFEYILKEELPVEFVPRALEFGQQIQYFGYKLFADDGVVVAGDRGGHTLTVGHLTWSLPHWDVYYKDVWSRRGQLSERAYCCSIAMNSDQLGLPREQTRAFAHARMAGADDWSRLLLMRMENRFKMAGFALELNEDGIRLHLYYGADPDSNVGIRSAQAAFEEKRLSRYGQLETPDFVHAVFDGRHLQVPAAAWTEKKE